MSFRIMHLAPLLLVSCHTTGTTGDASFHDVPDVDGIRGCTSPSDCAMGVDYTTLDRCAQPGAYSASHVEAEECITALGEVPPSSCVDCSVTTESGRGGRLMPGRTWATDCVSGACEASEETCTPTECPSDGGCTSSLDCFLTTHCLSGTCTSGCDTGFDCATTQVCVREPADAEFGRCVFSG